LKQQVKLNNKQWQRQQQQQQKLTVNQKYPVLGYMLKQKLLDQKSLEIIKKHIGHKVGRKKKGEPEGSPIYSSSQQSHSSDSCCPYSLSNQSLASFL
jgi:hypothetical protein